MHPDNKAEKTDVLCVVVAVLAVLLAVVCAEAADANNAQKIPATTKILTFFMTATLE